MSACRTSGIVASRREFLKGAAAAVAGATALAGWTPSAGGAAAPSPASQIGCYTRPWSQYEYRVALDAIAAAGFRYAGMMSASNKTWASPKVTIDEATAAGQEIRKRGMKAISIYGDFSVAQSLAEGITGLNRLIDICAACECPYLLLGGTGNAKLYDNYYKAIAECCGHAQQNKVVLTIKPHGGKNATGPQCRKAIEDVGHSNFRLWYDAGNIFYYSDGALDPVNDSKTVDGLVVGMSIKDFLPPKEVLVTPGTGKVDFPKVMANLKSGGFTGGPLVVECLDKGDPAKLAADAVKARKFVEALVA